MPTTHRQASPRIFEEVAKFGEASVRRIYGDFSGQRLKVVGDILQKYAIDTLPAVCLHDWKNASEIALVLDAMDLTQRSASTFLRLVSSGDKRLHAPWFVYGNRVPVFGFGEQKNPESFRQACRKLILH